MSNYLKRIGLLGGTFNPVHFGHLRSAVEVQHRFALESVCFIPSLLPPHKDSSCVADAMDRLEMIRMAISGYPALTVSDVELKRSGPSYTIDTVKHFKSFQTDQTDFYLIVGLDAFLEIDTWKSFRELFGLVPFIVMSRPGLNYEDSATELKNLGDYLNSKISTGYYFSKQDSCYMHKANKPVYIFEVSLIDISSTKIRRMVQKGEPISFLVPANVELFIKSRDLYR
ncbi:MAG: nicotinate-nucleotide adenylyltransferase [Desulfobacterales bacterium]